MKIRKLLSVISLLSVSISLFPNISNASSEAIIITTDDNAPTLNASGDNPVSTSGKPLLYYQRYLVFEKNSPGYTNTYSPPTENRVKFLSNNSYRLSDTISILPDGNKTGPVQSDDVLSLHHNSVNNRDGYYTYKSKNYFKLESLPKDKFRINAKKEDGSVGLSFLSLSVFPGTSVTPFFQFHTFIRDGDYLATKATPAPQAKFPPVENRPSNLLFYEKSLSEKVPLRGLEYTKDKVTFKLAETDFKSHVKFVVRINDGYIGESYDGKTWYAIHSTNSGITSITRSGLNLKNGDKITVTAETHKPGQRGLVLSTYSEDVHL